MFVGPPTVRLAPQSCRLTTACAGTSIVRDENVIGQRQGRDLWRFDRGRRWLRVIFEKGTGPTSPSLLMLHEAPLLPACQSEPSIRLPSITPRDLNPWS